MIKHLQLKKLLATLLTIAAVFAGQQASATITDFMSIRGQSANINGQYYYVWSISGFMGQFSQPMTQGNSYTFNGQNIGLDRGDVHITGTLNFAESNELTDVTTGSQVTIVFSSDQFWFYGATVKKLDGTNVTGCSASASSDHTSITVTIPSGKTFGYIYLDFVAYEPFYNYNTTISGVESTYIYTGRPIEPVPTVTYNGRTLTAGTDYTVSYSNTTGPGSASVTVTGTGQYAGTVTRNYNIRAVALTDFNSLGSNTYAIATTADLDHLAGYVNLGNECQGLTFKQTANITFTHSDDWDNSSSTENNYTAIGTEGNPFQGTYDGQNHTISGIRIYKGGTSNSDKRQGIFGAVSTDGTVKRVNLADARITGCDEVGGIVGMTFKATIEDCTVGADVCIHAVKSSTYSHGGIVGFNESAVRRCISRATLTVKNGLTGCNRYGGIVGFNNNSGTVTDCIAVGAVIPDVEGRGAIVGYNNYNSTLIRNYYRDCKVASNNVTPSGVGMGTSQSGTTTSDVDGAQPLFALTLGTNVTLERTAEATLPGTNNKTYANGADIAGVHYAYPTATVTLGYSGTVPAGQTPLYSVDGTAIWGNTFTMPTADCTVSVEIVDGWSGSGTQSDPYVITTTSHLNLLAEMVKNGVNYSGTYFVLGNDIAYSTAGLGDTDENFTTIGGYFNSGDKNFSGIFDGQGHTISGIRLYKNGTAAPSMNQGLFGRISDATIQNVILTDARITGYRYVGGLVGNKVSGTVQNCLVLESTITCADKYVGALFGKNTGTITANYYHNCTVNGTAVSVGVGGNGGVSASSDTDGARSVHTLTLQNGDITATGSTVAYQGTTWYASTTTVTLGYDNLLEGCVATYSLDGNVLTGNTFTMPAADATVNGTFVSHWHADADHDGTTEERAYIITTTAGLDLLAKKVNGTDGYTANSFSGKYFLQAANLTYDGTANNYTPIGDNDHIFKGHYNGGGYAISGINVNTTGDRVGLFGHVGNQGSVENVTLANSTIRGNTQVGGIVGGLEYNGTLSNCRVGNDVTIGARSNNAFNHGGIVGICHISTIEGCTSAATITDDGSYYSGHYGGIVGFCQGNSIVKDCLYTGSTIIATGDKGAITGGCGTNGVVTLTNNYYTNADINFGGVNGNDVDGARRGYTITLQNENIAFIGTQTTYNASGLTAIGESVLCYNDGTTTTYYSGEGQTVTLDYTGSISSGERLIYSVNGTPIEGDSFEMPAQDVAVTAVVQARYTFDSTTGELALLWGEFNKDNKWGSEVTESAVTRVTATDEVSFTGDCFNLFYYFTHCTSMDLNNVNTDNLTNIRCMFWGCQSLTTLNLSSWNTAAVTEMTSAFRNCTGLTSLNLSGWNTANVTNMIYMFLDCSSLQSLDLSGWNTANVTDMSYMFRGCSGLQSLDLSGWNTAKVTNMQYMFYGCFGLQSLDLSGWNTAKVTNMSYMFNDCSGLQPLNVSGWNTANVTDMSHMFHGCSGLQSLNISGWNTANVTNMSGMFDGCSGLQSLDLTGWNTANVTNMSGMFEGCSGLQSLDLSGWNTAKVTNMQYMFYGCFGLQSLDLSGWNTAKVTNMSYMFRNCTDLATIYVGGGWSTSRVGSSNYMFSGCTSLVGGMGTHYISIHTDKAYARIDMGPSSEQPGYLTGRFNKDIAGYGTGTGGWYLIASPVPSITPSPDNGFITDDNSDPDNLTYDLYYFDQTGDANGKEWKNYRAHPEFTSLVSGQGYLYASKNGTTLIFSGAPYNGEGQVDLTYFEVNGNQGMWGWNLIGNPFAETANLPSGLSYYTLNDTRSELIAGNASTIGAMEAIFVKATGTGQSVQFTKQSRGGISRGSTAAVNAILSLNLTDNHNRLIDRAIVRFDEGQPLPKFQIRETSTKVYIPQKGKDYAVINVCTDGACTVSTEMPVNFKAEENGEYTITVNIDNVEVNYLHLIDNLTGNDVDLLALRQAQGPVSYTFTAKTTDYESRFKLVFICGDTNDDNDGDNATFAFYSNGNWIIANEGEATLQVVDVMGRILSSETISGSINKAIDAVPGMYVLRLVNGNDIKTQKIVVK